MFHAKVWALRKSAEGRAAAGDVLGAARALDEAEGLADDLDGRCVVAVARAELLGEREAAAERLRALRPATAHEAWTLGNAWKAIGEEASAKAVFEAALDGVASLRDALTVARAFDSHGLADGRERAFEKA